MGSVAQSVYIAGIYEHPTRKAVDKSLGQLYFEIAQGAVADAGLSLSDVDAFYCDTDAPGFGPLSIIEYLGIEVRHYDSTDVGGSAPMVHLSHAAQAIATGKCNVALVTMAGKPRTGGRGLDTQPNWAVPELAFELPYAHGVVDQYAMSAMRHMYEFDTTAEQLAWIKVAASHHAQHNPHAMLRDVVTVEQVLGSVMIADPLHRLDCCVVSDGGGAFVVVSQEIARQLKRPRVRLRGAGEAIRDLRGGTADITSSGAVVSGATAFAEAGLKPSDIKYASLYDSFTITVLIQLEDLGFCKRGQGGAFVSDGKLISGVGKLPINTDGGGLCSNHPGNRGGMTKILEAVRQLREEAHPAVQVRNCDLALAHGTGGWLASRHGSATVILERV
ncbi:thiolase domain-containing protein [Mesorhizobium ciceri]|uniref:thiolase domain-containing protein n=1 Tax=Mesorhizobium TaxID=68287 RepID=UPI00047B17B2|nr:thiolase domain-containing protein [Mesorhizobium ciceri]